MKTGLIKNILPEDATSWMDKLFVSTDIDWANDKVIEYTFDFFDQMGVKVTWFATHETILNKKINEHPSFDIGAHPNYNFLLSGKNEYNSKAILENVVDSIPPTKTIRSHSITQSSILLQEFKDFGFTHDSNMFVPIDSGINTKPFRHFNDLIRVPYIWSDDVHMVSGWNYKSIIEKIKFYEGLKVIDCHPIHIYLNSANLKHYNDARPYLSKPDELKRFINTETYGTRDFLTDLFKHT